MSAAAAWQQLSRHADVTAGVALDAQAGGQPRGGAAAAAAVAMPDERLLRATRAMKLKDFDTAHKLLSQEAGGKPGSFIVFDLRAACCLHSGKHDQALDDALLCTKLNPDWARGWARLGAANLCLGRQRAAMAAYRRGLELSPGHAEMALGLQLAQQAVLAQGDRRKAMHHAE